MFSITHSAGSDIGSRPSKFLHLPVGKTVPDLAFKDGTRLGTYLRPGCAVLFRFGNSSNPSAVEEQERFRLIRAACVEPPPVGALFVRPDGFIAWAGEGDRDGLATVFPKWLGAAVEAAVGQCQLCAGSMEPSHRLNPLEGGSSFRGQVSVAS